MAVALGVLCNPGPTSTLGVEGGTSEVGGTGVKERAASAINGDADRERACLRAAAAAAGVVREREYWVCVCMRVV